MTKEKLKARSKVSKKMLFMLFGQGEEPSEILESFPTRLAYSVPSLTYPLFLATHG